MCTYARAVEIHFSNIHIFIVFMHSKKNMLHFWLPNKILTKFDPLYRKKGFEQIEIKDCALLMACFIFNVFFFLIIY